MSLWSSPPPLEPAIVQPITQLLREPYAWADGLEDRFGTLHRDLSTTPYALAPLAVIAVLIAQIGCCPAFDGMQPTLTHVPPRVLSCSTHTVLRPSCAARIAAT